MSLALARLRIANAARQAEWDKSNGIDLAYRGCEFAGEVGEACNVIKKLSRERMGIRGSRATVEDLAAELADVVICADLIAMGEGVQFEYVVHLGDPVRHRMAGLAELGNELAAKAFGVCGLIFDNLGPTFMVARLCRVILVCNEIAAAEGIDLGAAVVAKFNATSEKVGLATRLELQP